MIRLLCTSHTAKLTGSAMSLYTLLGGLDRRQFTPFVLLAEDGPLVERLEGLGIDHARVPYRGWRKLLTTSRAAAVLREQRIDLVYLNCVVGFSSAVARAAARLDLPMVWHVREPPGSSRVRRHRDTLTTAATTIVVVSEEQRRALAGPTPVVKVDNGVDLSRFAPRPRDDTFRQRCGLPPAAFVFGMIGTIEDRKNTLQFLEAAARVAAEDPDVRFLVVGGGHGDYRERVRRRAEADPLLQSRTVFTGEIWDVPQAMAAIDCLVMPSKWEGFPRVLLECMSIGTPAIASDVGDVRYMLDDGRTGFVVPTDDLDALTAAMRVALARRAELPEIGAAASDDARRRFSQAAHVERMSTVLRESAAVHRRGR